MTIPTAIEAFFEESDSHLETMESSLLALEKKSGSKELINELFRAAHSLKGNAGLVGLNDIHSTAITMETILDEIRQADASVGQEQRDVLFGLLDTLKSQVENARHSKEPVKRVAVGTKKQGSNSDAEKQGSSGDAEKQGSNGDVEKQGSNGDAEKQGSNGDAEKQGSNGDAEAKNKTVKNTKSESEDAKNGKGEKQVFLTFLLGSEYYGVDINAVREIILRRHITRVPNAKRFVTGIMNLRGMVVPVIDAKKKLDFAGKSEDKAENIIIVEKDGFNTGVLVDMVKDIVKLDKNAIIPAKVSLAGMKSEYIMGIGQTEETAVILLNLDLFCDPADKYC